MFYDYNKPKNCSMMIKMEELPYIYEWFVESSTALCIVQGMHRFLVRIRWVARQIVPAHCLNLARNFQEIKDDLKDICVKCYHKSVYFPLKSIKYDIVDTALFHGVKEFLDISTTSIVSRHGDFYDTYSS